MRSDVLTTVVRGKKYPLSVLPLSNLEKGYAPQTLAYNLLYNQTSSPFLALFREAVFGERRHQGPERPLRPVWDRIIDQAQA